jgi:hypothetical protein
LAPFADFPYFSASYEIRPREFPSGRLPRSGSESQARGRAGMDVKIKLSIAFNVSETSLEDALAEYDEITVERLMREVIDKAIACEEVSVHVEEGPNTLEDLDAMKR